jgi:hypothetical protein
LDQLTLDALDPGLRRRVCRAWKSVVGWGKYGNIKVDFKYIKVQGAGAIERGGAAVLIRPTIISRRASAHLKSGQRVAHGVLRANGPRFPLLIICVDRCSEVARKGSSPQVWMDHLTLVALVEKLVTAGGEGLDAAAKARALAFFVSPDGDVAPVRRAAETALKTAAWAVPGAAGLRGHPPRPRQAAVRNSAPVDARGRSCARTPPYRPSFQHFLSAHARRNKPRREILLPHDPPCRPGAPEPSTTAKDGLPPEPEAQVQSRLI